MNFMFGVRGFALTTQRLKFSCVVLLGTPNLIFHIFDFSKVPEGSQDIQYAAPVPCS